MSNIRRNATIVAGSLMIVGMSLGALAAPSVFAAGPCVNPGGTGGCSSTIQAAVNTASPGAVIHVAAGTYHEDVMIKTAISLLGAGAGKSVIDAASATPHYGVTIWGVHSKTVLRGFTIEKAPLAGIQVRASSHVVIRKNTVDGNDTNLNTSKLTCAGALPFDAMDCGEGINLNGAIKTIVDRNVIQNNAGGILLSDEYGKTRGNVIENNAVQNNVLDCGITLASHPHSFPGGKPGPGYGVFNNMIKNNSSTNNGGAGVGIFDPTPGTQAYNNTVENNVLSGNGLAGVMMHSHAPNQNLSGNKIIGNWIGLNNIFGDSDSGNMQTTGILSWSAVSPLTSLVIKNNVIVGGNHFGIWVVGPINSTISGNKISADVPIYTHS
jgi:Right handed beta helix region